MCVESGIYESDSLCDATGKFLDAFFSAQEIVRIQREFEKVRVRVCLSGVVVGSFSCWRSANRTSECAFDRPSVTLSRACA